eukprot:scaffold1163_cov362-Prasinococcus_capsulatus_cf.AAC.11
MSMDKVSWHGRTYMGAVVVHVAVVKVHLQRRKVEAQVLDGLEHRSCGRCIARRVARIHSVSTCYQGYATYSRTSQRTIPLATHG